MSRFGQIAAAVVLAGAGVVLTPAPAAAQFQGGFGIGPFPLRPLPSLPSLPALPFRPLQPLPPGFIPTPFYGYSQRFSITAPNGQTVGFARDYFRAGTGYWAGYFMTYPQAYSSYMPGGGSSGYISGGVRNPVVEAVEKNFPLAQRQAELARLNPAPARTQIHDTWAYEKFGVAGGLAELAAAKDHPEALQKALAAGSGVEVASGEALNHIAVAAIAAESKGAKAASAYLPPNLLAEVRFTGSPAADTLNLFRTAGKLEFPSAFDTGGLPDLKAALDRDFAAATAPLLVGKPADPAKQAKLAATVQSARDKLTPLMRDLPFEDATAARRFLNQLDAAVKVLKEPTAAGLVNGKWATEGTTVADLVRHMAKHKLLFGPAEKGSEEAYFALHRGLATYVTALTDAQAKK